VKPRCILLRKLCLSYPQREATLCFIMEPPYYLQREATRLWNDCSSKSLIVTVDEGASVALIVNNTEVDSVISHIVGPRITRSN